MRRFLSVLAIASLAVGACAQSSRAEVSEISIAQTYGVSFLPLMVMERQGLVEKHVKQAGLDNVKTTWGRFATPTAINDGLIAGSIHFGAVGVPSLALLWDRTKGNVGIKALSAVSSYPLYLVSRNPDVKAVTDLTTKDRIAVPGVKISTAAIALQMAAAQAWGDDQYARLDPLTVGMANPDGVMALTTGNSGINGQFVPSPFYETIIKLPGAHLVTTSTKIWGGQGTGVVLIASSKFRDANPKVFKAVYDAMGEAMDIINKDKRAAAQLYIEMANDKSMSVDALTEIISSPEFSFGQKPSKVLAQIAFQAKIGQIKNSPASVGDILFPEAIAKGGD